MCEDVIEARENIKKAITATREGKISSLAKIMKVNKADFSQVEVSQDDKMNVILEGIYSEIRELKDSNQRNFQGSIRIANKSNVVTPDNGDATKWSFMSLSLICDNSNKINKFNDNLQECKALKKTKILLENFNRFNIQIWYDESMISYDSLFELVCKTAERCKIEKIIY